LTRKIDVVRCAALALGTAGLLLAGLVLPVRAYVPEGPHLIALMAKALAGPRQLRVLQQVEDNPVRVPVMPDRSGFYQSPAGQNPEPVAVERDSANEAAEAGLRPRHWNETLSFIFPDRFRKDAWIGGINRVEIINGDKQVCIVGGEIRSWKPDRGDAYIEPLLYRRRFLLERKLAERGVDINVSSLGLRDHRLVYVIGASFPDTSVVQLWIDKQNFLPLRWIFPARAQDASGKPESKAGLEIVYSGWKKDGRTWYPERIEFFRGQRLIRRIDVQELLPEADFAEALFDLEYLEAVYGPELAEKKDDERDTEEKDMDEVRKAIDAFHKKFKD